MNNDKDTGFIVGSALRYALYRHSYAPSLVADYIRRHWLKLDANTQHNILRDLSELLEDCKEWQNDPCNSIDYATWQNLHTHLQQQPTKH